MAVRLLRKLILASLLLSTIAFIPQGTKEQVGTTTTDTKSVSASITPTQILSFQGAVAFALPTVPVKPEPEVKKVVAKPKPTPTPAKPKAVVTAVKQKAEPVDKTSNIIVSHIKKYGVSDSVAKKYASYIIKYSKQYDHDPLWITAMLDVESDFKASIVSGHGAVGLMQILPSTARAFDVSPSKLKDPKVNIELGARYLRYLTDRFGKELGTVAYNQGEGNVSKKKYRTWYLKKVKEALKGIDTSP